jgi:tetraacyldisaccharide 4'-kinase
MKQFFLSLMTDTRRGPAVAPLKAVLYLASLVYGLAIIARRILYSLRIFRRETVPMRIVSVGNISLGGTGKTPFVIALVGIVRSELRREPCVLIRGYGWDETALLKRSLTDTPILAAEDRVKQAHRAIKLYGSTMGILDDGFQYWELERDLDIVLVDSRSPFGNGMLFPRGLLRESPSALRRADVIVFTKTDKKGPGFELVKDDIRRINDKAVLLEARHRPKHLYDPKARREYGLEAMRGKRVMLLSSIGDPGYFQQTVEGLDANVVEHIEFGDHHDYSVQDADRISKRLEERSFEYIITTEKDAVKLARKSIYFGKHTLLILAVEMEITAGKEHLIARLHSLYRG